MASPTQTCLTFQCSTQWFVVKKLELAITVNLDAIGRRHTTTIQKLSMHKVYSP